MPIGIVAVIVRAAIGIDELREVAEALFSLVFVPVVVSSSRLW